ncbi:MAG TPA: cytochrome ubiquinol oxidase subunit I [Candidatus Acidoferrales bacterium]|nr:cytochrome ubiquinol oxidase subunit I [Candidatus Acidoferrales bacterium]
MLAPHAVGLATTSLAAPAVAAAADLLAARSQMAITLGFHIVLACLGVAFPALMLIAEWRGRRGHDPDALLLAQRWSKVVAVTFAVGAVSGTVLSFEMGLLWPGLIGRFGSAFGIPFALEGIAFFLEAIFVAIYLYGWRRLGSRAHLLSGVPIALAGLVGTFSVVTANAWMNEPAGFTLGADGQVTSVQPLGVLFNDATGYEVVHMFLAAYMVTGFLVASVYAVSLLRGHRDHYTRLGFALAFSVAVIATPLQIAVGDVAARAVRDQQPAKFAAMELISVTGSHQPETIGGVLANGRVVGGVAIPDVASLLSGFSPDTVIAGLNAVPPDQRPPADVVHLAWNAMVGIGTLLLIPAVWFVLAWWRRRELPSSAWFLRLAGVAGLAAVVAMEAGWVVTEVGRQPWLVYGLLRTSDAVTHAPGIVVSLVLTTALYLVLGATTVVVISGMARRWQRGSVADGDVPYGPREAAAR